MTDHLASVNTQILNLVHISPSYARAEVGQPIPVTLSIRPTFTWSNGKVREPLVLSYDVTAKLEDWLISGRKRAEFNARVSLTRCIALLPTDAY